MSPLPALGGAPTVVGRYAIYNAIASGGMATVHLGRLIGPAGFSRTVAIKRLHPHLAHDRDVADMLLDEARLVARIQHPNVVPTLDVVFADQELLLVMEYVRGDSLARLVRAATTGAVRLPPNVVVAILSGVLAGLHAAHEATDERGESLGIVHRDVSPQNIMVGVDGTARVLDFGIAKAAGRIHTTQNGAVKGKVLYMAREQLAGETLTHRVDIHAVGIILFEALTNARMFAGNDEVVAISRIVANDLRVPSEVDPSLAPFDVVVRRACAPVPRDRYATAHEMALELENICAAASPTLVGEWVRHLAGSSLDERARMVADLERSTRRSRSPVPLTTPDEETSQPSTSGVVSVASVPRSRLVFVAVCIALLAGGALGIILSRQPRAAPLVAPTTAAASDPAAPRVVAAAASVENASAWNATASAAEPAAAVPAAGPASAKTAAAVSAQPPQKRGHLPKTQCDPPWIIDKSGHKHFIPECVE